MLKQKAVDYNDNGISETGEKLFLHDKFFGLAVVRL